MMLRTQYHYTTPEGEVSRIRDNYGNIYYLLYCEQPKPWENIRVEDPVKRQELEEYFLQNILPNIIRNP